MYDPVIGKMLAPDYNIPNPYSAVGDNRYDYAFNNPLLYTDPTGEEFANWGDFNEALQKLWDTDNGGYATGADDVHGFTSQGGMGGTFDAGADYLGSNNLWGTNGFANSFGDAQNAYYANGGTDQNVRYLLQTTFVVGKIANDQWQTSQYNGKDLIFYPGQYTVDKNGNAVLQWEEESKGINWHGVAGASLGIVGGAAEWVAGGVSEWLSGGAATPLTIPLFTDGGVRIGANATRLFGYFTGHDEMAEAMPTSIGATVGKGIDMASGKSFYEYGVGQAIGGSTNDLASFIITGGSGQPLADFMENQTITNGFFYGTAAPGYILGQYDNFAPLKH